MTHTPGTARDLIETLQRRIDEVLSALIPRGTRVALLDFPNYSNVGDSAIWLGASRWLARNGNRRAYVCEFATYSASVLRRVSVDGPILLSGGGNFGDLWPEHQRLRERVIRDFPDRPIVQLPQSVHFQHRDALERAAAVIDAHPHFTLLVRDRRSAEISSRTFRCTVTLCPDMAFVLGPLTPPHAASTAHVFLKRKDSEAPPESSAHAGSAGDVVDWIDEPRTLSRAGQLLRWSTARYPNRMLPVTGELADFLARRRVRRGIDLLSRGRHVTTDRLHGHILCLLLGIPHTVRDNAFGKVSAFVDQWTRGTCDVAWDASTAPGPDRTGSRVSGAEE